MSFYADFPRVKEKQPCGVLALPPTLLLVFCAPNMSNKNTLCLSDAHVVNLPCAWTAHWGWRTQITNALTAATARANLKGDAQCGGQFTQPTGGWLQLQATTPRAIDPGRSARH